MVSRPGVNGERNVLPESAKPYLLNGVHQWCVDQGYTPHILVLVAYPGVAVPSGYEKDGRMTLNISPNACRNLNMADGWIRFNARFSGVARTVDVPMAAVIAIYAAETQEGMGFAEPVLPDAQPPASGPAERSGRSAVSQEKPERPSLRVIK